MNDIDELIQQSEDELKDLFKQLEDNAEYNQQKVLSGFRELRVSTRHFAGTTGYGYNDDGRDTLNNLFAKVLGAEKGLVTPYIANGSHALALTLFAVLRHPGQKMLTVTGKPYETLSEVIHGREGEDIGSLKDLGVTFDMIELRDNKVDYEAIEKTLSQQKFDLIHIQRSRGYGWRDALSVEDIRKIADIVRKYDKDAVIMVDNCYGEFTEKLEPVQVGADVQVGSLMKNCGGGLAPNGAYIVGTEKVMDAVGRRFTSPSLGLEVGAYAHGYQYFYQGFFMAPHITMQAQKGCLLMAKTFKKLGYNVFPDCTATPRDIITSIELGSREKLLAVSEVVQAWAPIDSYVTPEPGELPGYLHEVIMSAGTFISGSTMEMSCDAPVIPPYILYIQGGLTYEHIKIVLKQIVKKLKNL